MITVAVAYRRLKKRLGPQYKIIDGFEVRDAYVFSVTDKDGQDGYPFFSVLKRDGTIGGYNPMQNISEYMKAIKNAAIDIDAIERGPEPTRK